jgi:hypothetical protein
MSEPHSDPDTWAAAASAWSEEFFSIRVLQCDSLPHLRAAVEYEATHECRRGRIQRLNERIETVKP